MTLVKNYCKGLYLYRSQAFFFPKTQGKNKTNKCQANAQSSNEFPIQVAPPIYHPVHMSYRPRPNADFQIG